MLNDFLNTCDQQSVKKCNNLVSNAKIAHYSKVSENIRLEKAGSKNWWTLVKSLTGNNDCSQTIPPIEHNGNLVFDDIEKYPLCKLFNISLSLSSFPSEWKLANVTPVFKKDSPGILKNYRPISLISIVGKVMERCVYKHIYNFLLENRIISSNQSGFTFGDSAINQL